MKKKVLTSIAVVTLVSAISIAQVLNKKNAAPVESESKVGEYKEKTREKLKPYRYDGTKVTNFNYMKYDQTKEIEVLLFNGNDYKLCFNGEGAPVGINIKMYDISKESAGNYPEKRIMLKEIASFKGETTVELNDLNAKYAEAKLAKYTNSGGEDKDQIKRLKESQLKRVFVEYTIPEAPYVQEQLPPKSKAEPRMVPQKGFCVLTFGYKNN
jgi:hypothetical protein